VKKLWPLMKTACMCGHLGQEHHPERAGFGACTHTIAVHAANASTDGVLQLQVQACPCEQFTPSPPS
jgi:hypothetical protein